MVNPIRGEIEAQIDGEKRTLCLTLGALAQLEHDLGATDLSAIGARFEKGNLSANHVLLILRAGLEGGGTTISVEDLAHARFEGGSVGAIKLAAQLLTITFGQKP